MTKAVAYYGEELMMSAKSFVQAPEVEACKNFFLLPQ
jgi:hypothetical protein